MIVYFQDKNIKIPNNFENIEKKLLDIPYWNRSKIYNLLIDNEQFIIKQFELIDSNFDIEKNIYIHIHNICKNSFFFKKFMIKYLYIATYPDHHIILMKKLNYTMNNKFLNGISKNEKNNLLLQSLLTIYEMNHEYTIYFNDIYNNNKILNFMIHKNNNTKKRIYNYKLINNKNIFFYKKKYEIRIIDYGRINTRPGVNTKKYMVQFFNHLYEKNIVSEVLLFFLFFYTTIHPSPEYQNNMVQKLNNIINENILSNENFNQNISSLHFDTLLLSYLYDSEKQTFISLKN